MCIFLLHRMANHWRMFILVTVTFWLLSTGQLAQHDEEDWIDPGDMLNYDPGSKKMINQKLQKVSIIKHFFESMCSFPYRFWLDPIRNLS